MNNSIIIIGGGAAGFFAAITAAEANPEIKVLILEKTTKFLSKVKVSGGGRCNVTHHCFVPHALAENYPRGNKELKAIFKKFQAKDTVAWFEKRGVKLKTEADGRMFPQTDNSQTIIDCFLSEAQRLNIEFRSGFNAVEITKDGELFHISTDQETLYAKKVIIATGGNANEQAYSFLKKLGHKIINPIPSLFTFNDPTKTLAELSGISVANAEVKIATTKFSQSGPLLITHWGLSGPAVIKLSAWAAKELFDRNYTFTALVSWIGTVKEEETRTILNNYKTANPKRTVVLYPLFELPQRLWLKFCQLAEIDEKKIWGETSNKNLNKLLECLIRFPFPIKGKTTFKEEFVTCGGIDLKEVNLETMESKIVPGLYFAGEVLNIDGITGGFNFQAAWTTGWIAGRSAVS